MNVLRVVDPHFHVWDLETGFYPHFQPKPGADTTAPTSRSYLFEEYLDEGGSEVEVLKAVFVEAIPTDPLGEARNIQALVDGSRMPIALVARTDLSAPDSAERIDALAELPILRGIRQILNRHDDPDLNYVDVDYMDEPAWQRGLGALKARSLGFDLQIYPHQMSRAAEVAGAHPDVPFILNHAGMWADRTLEGWREWRSGLRRLAERDNVAVKISGLGMLDPAWTLNSIRPLVYEVLDAFGIGRAMFASNFPVDKPGASFVRLWQGFDALTGDLSEDERVALFRGNAERIYRI